MKCIYPVDPTSDKRCGKEGKKHRMIYDVFVLCDEHYELEKKRGRADESPYAY